MKRIVLAVMLFLSEISLLSATTLSDSLLIRLDRIVRERSVYAEERAGRIQALNNQLHSTGDNELRYRLYGKLFTEYHSFNTDSSLFIARQRYRVAEELKNPVYLDDSRMNIAEIMGTTGMFKEALELMNGVNRSRLPARKKKSILPSRIFIAILYYGSILPVLPPTKS